MSNFKKNINLQLILPGLFTGIFFIFFTLKLMEKIDLSWLVVTAPLWLPLAILAGILLIVYYSKVIRSTIIFFTIHKVLMGAAAGYLIGNLIAYLHTYREPVFLQLYYVARLNGLNIPATMYPAYAAVLLGLIFPLLLISKNKGKYGYAKHATRADIQEMGLLQNKGLILGKSGGQLLRYKEALSSLILAPSGTGKTSGLVIPNLLLEQDNSMVVHDPKGELFKKTSAYRSKFSKISVFDPMSPYSSSFNPLDNALLVVNSNGKPDIVKSRPHIKRVAGILIPDPKSGDKYWTQAGRSMFIYLAMWLLWKDQKVSIPAIRELLFCQTNIVAMLKTMQSGEDPRGNVVVDDDEEIAQLRFKYTQLKKAAEEDSLRASEIDELADIKKRLEGPQEGSSLPDDIRIEGNSVLASSSSEKQFAGEVKSLGEQLNEFSDETLSNNIREGCDFTSEKLRKENMTLYVIVRDEDKKILRPILVLLFEILANQLTSKMPDDDDRTVTFLLDEFARLGEMEVIQQLPEVGRGYKANIVFIAQEYAQIQSAYDEKKAKVIESNCGYKVILRQTDRDYAKRISEAIGNRTVDRKSSSAEAGKIMAGRKSESTSEEGIPLISDQDILNQPVDQCLVLAVGHYARPITAKIPYWFKNKELKAIVDKYGFSEKQSLDEVYQELNIKPKGENNATSK